MRNIILSFLLLLTLSPLQGNALHLPLYAEGSFDFADGAAEAEEYAYDGCGALVMDLNRGIDNIEYDNLGHLKEIRFANKEYILYVYDPLGRKWQVRHSFDRDDEEDPGQGGIDISDVFVTGPVTSYGPGGTVYVDGALDRFLFPGGYATPEEGGGLRMHYYTCDHQGNIRVVMGGDGTLEQVTHYYPFGGIYGDAGLNAEFQPYKYNGKELDRMHGLDWYDYGERQYDAAGVPMFTTIDPMAEKYYHLSPYAYCANNPIKYIDLRGDSINASAQYQKFLDTDLHEAFGEKASAFSFNGNDNLTLNMSPKEFQKGLSRDQKKLFRGLAKVMNDDEVTSVVYENTYELNGKMVNVLEEYGGGAYSNGTIVIAPNAGDIEVIPDIVYYNSISKSIGTMQTVKQNTTSILFHEIGERILGDEKEYRGNVIDYENYVRRIIGLPERPYDITHKHGF